MTATSTGVGEPKLITSLTMSAGSNESRTSGNLHRKLPAEPLLEPFDVDLRPLLHGDAEDRLLRAAGPLVDGVDRVARRDQPHIADRDRHLVAADLLADRLQGGDRQLLGLLDTACRPAPASGAGTARRRPWGRSPGRVIARPARSRATVPAR